MSVTRRHTAPLIAAAAAALLALTGCGGNSGDAPDVGAGGELQDAATSEGALTIYASASESQIQRLADAFMEDYPDIQVDTFRAAGTALFNRFSTEAESGSMVADVFMPTVQPSFVADHPQWFQKLTDDVLPAAKDWPDEFRDDYTLQVAIEENLLAYNKDSISEPPASWEDVLDPKYKGRIVLADPESSAGYMSWYAVMREKFGDEFLEKLAAQQPTFVDTMAVGAQQVAAGSSDLAFPAYPSHTVSLIDQGAPIGEVKDLDPTQGVPTNLALTQGGPHPNAAKLFAAWLISPAGYEAICGDPVYSATTDGTPCQPLASHYVEPKWDLPQAEQDEIVELLGR